MYVNLIIDETKYVFRDPVFQKKCLQFSKSVPKLHDYAMGMLSYRRSQSQENLEAIKYSPMKIKEEESLESDRKKEVTFANMSSVKDLRKALK